MLRILVALAFLAAPSERGSKPKPQPAPREDWPVVHHLRCQEGQRLFDALVAAKVALKVETRPGTSGDTKTVSLPKLDCVWHNGGAYEEGTKDFVTCEAPKLEGEAAMRIHQALIAARIPMDVGMMKAASSLKDLTCKATAATAECTMINELVMAPNGRDVRQDDFKPKCEQR